MFNRVFVEKELREHLRAKRILSKLGLQKVEIVERYDDIWGQVKKPYLQKRQGLDLFIAKKRGQLIKKAPAAYGTVGAHHYYFIHAFNCIYECEYCYLQGYFHTPDLVFFINHEDILAEMKTVLGHHAKDSQVWFHGGEFSDSLALSHLSDEWEVYFDFFKANPKAYLELRTKSANTKALKNLSPLPNIVVSYSLSPFKVSQKIDRKTPTLKARLKAIEELALRGYLIGIHLDPIIDSVDLEKEYGELLDSLLNTLPTKQLSYLSLGVVRFTPAVFRQVQKNYPRSPILAQELTKSFDGKVRYSRPHRNQILEQIKTLCLKKGICEEKIYLCMEE